MGASYLVPFRKSWSWGGGYHQCLDIEQGLINALTLNRGLINALTLNRGFIKVLTLNRGASKP